MECGKSYKEVTGGWFLFYFRQVKQFYEYYFSVGDYRLTQ